MTDPMKDGMPCLHCGEGILQQTSFEYNGGWIEAFGCNRCQYSLARSYSTTPKVIQMPVEDPGSVSKVSIFQTKFDIGDLVNVDPSLSDTNSEDISRNPWVVKEIRIHSDRRISYSIHSAGTASTCYFESALVKA